MGTIMALRNDILKPGGYASLPHCVLESTRLEPGDKLVYQVLLDYLGGNDSVWPSQATIARRTALSIRGVRRSVARLIEVGLISCEIITGTSNHYTFSAPEAVLNTEADADSVSDLSQRGGGHDDRTNPDTLSAPPATLTGLSGHDGRGSTDTVADEPLHLTTSLEPPQRITSVDSPHSPTSGGLQPSAAESETDTILSFLQGVRDMNPVAESYAILLTAWIKQKRPLPSYDKVKIGLGLLKAQQKKTGQILSPAAVLAVLEDGTLEFTDLFQRSESGKYRWQTLQNRNVLAGQLEEIYDAYPRHIEKATALKAIRAAVKRMQARGPDKDAVAFLLERTRLFAASPDGNKGRYTPFPANWFDKERYLDDEKEWYATENRSGSLKREAAEQDETPGESFQDAVKRLTKK